MSMKKTTFFITFILITLTLIQIQIPPVQGYSYNGIDLANAILADPSTLVSSFYTEVDPLGRQGSVFTQKGIMLPTEGSEFIVMSTGISTNSVATTDGLDPGDERGSWFTGGQYLYPRDSATLTLTLEVPQYMHYLYYDIQFFTTEYPEYVGSQYNDKIRVTVNSPSQGITTYTIDVNGGDFVLNAHDIPGTSFDVFATSGNPDNVDWVTTTPNPTGADGGATALVGREHPVSPLEQITVTFEIKDDGDNQLDSCAFIDNLRFSGFAKTELIARKTVQDLNGNRPEPDDTLEYTVTISNIGTADQQNNPGYEFEDLIPDNSEYVPNSAIASSGTISYDSNDNKIYWDGTIPSESSVALSFQTTINPGLVNGTQIINQGTVHWDSDEDGTNDADELTDDPTQDDGIDSDGDGETNDDDPTITVVYSFDAPTILTENFADDTPGGSAIQTYEGLTWFETSTKKAETNFEVAPAYHYATSKSFKTKLRATYSPQYWNYSYEQLNSNILWWETWFALGNTSENADLYLTFKNTNGNTIAQLKFQYIQTSNNPADQYIAKLYYQLPSGQWFQISTDHTNGYLYTGWYQIKIEQNGDDHINYTLCEAGKGQIFFKTDNTLGTPFTNLKRVEFSSTKNPVHCPLFFWDEHRLGLIPNT